MIGVQIANIMWLLRKYTVHNIKWYTSTLFVAKTHVHNQVCRQGTSVLPGGCQEWFFVINIIHSIVYSSLFPWVYRKMLV